MKYKPIIISFVFIVMGLPLISQLVSKQLAEKVAKNYYKMHAPRELEVLKKKDQCEGKFKKSARSYQMDTAIYKKV